MKTVQSMKLATVFALTASIIGVPAAAPVCAAPLMMANNAVVLSSEALIERSEVGADGKERIITKQPKDVIVVPGDRVIFTLKYVNNGSQPATGFRATNPLPAPVQFVSVFENWAEVSVDGGASWGKLDQLKVSKEKADGSGKEVRAAGPEDVTHVRWVFADPIAPGAKGSVSFRGMIK
jgi:uncharacterized repeat protein (TIGR01451 family)